MKIFIKQVLHLLDKDKKKLPVIILFFLMSSLLDLIGIGLIGPYIALLVDVDIASGLISDAIILFGLPSNKEQLVISIGYILLIVFLTKAIFAIWINRVIVKFSESQHIRLIKVLMSSYQSLSYVDYIRRNSSEYVYSIHQLSNQYANHVVSPLLRMLSDGIVVSAIVIFLALQSPAALGLLLLLIVVMMFIYDSIFRRKMNTYGEQLNLAASAIIKGVTEGIEGMKEIRILGKEQYFYKNVTKEADKLANYAIKSTVVSQSLRYLLELTMIAFVVSLVLITLNLGGNIPALIPTLSVFGVAALRLFPAVNTFMQSLMQMRYGKDSVSRLMSDLKDIQNIEMQESNIKPAPRLKENFEELQLDNVYFSYPASNINALENISLKIKAGESIGIIGPSGSGKTTLLDTLLGLFDPQKGDIIFNKKNIKDDLTQWQSQVAYIPQQVFLVDGTLQQNITFGLDDFEVEEERLNKSLHQARLSDLVNELPEGVNTILGERGIRFSGGQRQRVALARAFYHGRNVIVMDEATSALDSETEREIVGEIERLKGTKTMIVIAHRLSTLKHCDRIYELKNGRVINEGSYDKIVRRIDN